MSSSVLSSGLLSSWSGDWDDLSGLDRIVAAYQVGENSVVVPRLPALRRRRARCVSGRSHPRSRPDTRPLMTMPANWRFQSPSATGTPELRFLPLAL